VVRLGLALPQYDYSVAGESPLPWARVVEWARAAEAVGFDSVWLSDHLFLDVAKYGGPPDRHGCLDPIVSLAALAGEVTRVRLGTLVVCEALRPATVLAKALASLDVVCDGRLDVGVGAGWYEPEYEAIGMRMPRPGERIDRLREAVAILDGLLGGGPCTFDGRFHRAAGAVNEPAAVPRSLTVIRQFASEVAGAHSETVAEQGGR
jgi:alkanesulfonate monooxygenase SsuD/methylene tetrahydromethanopterin reductase-like flavin-dependent oxidoreductase (luciferase family)